MCITVGTGKPLIDPYEWVKARVSSARFVLTFDDGVLKVCKRMLSGVEEVRLYAPTLGSFRGNYHGVDVYVVRVWASSFITPFICSVPPFGSEPPLGVTELHPRVPLTKLTKLIQYLT